MEKNPKNAVEAFAVYASYDANAPDTADVVVVATEELAKQAIEILKAADKDPNAGFSGPICEGWEFCKEYSYRNVLAYPEDVANSEAEIIAQIKGE